jgi:hypothetical protein
VKVLVSGKKKIFFLLSFSTQKLALLCSQIIFMTFINSGYFVDKCNGIFFLKRWKLPSHYANITAVCLCVQHWHIKLNWNVARRILCHNFFVVFGWRWLQVKMGKLCYVMNVKLCFLIAYMRRFGELRLHIKSNVSGKEVIFSTHTYDINRVMCCDIKSLCLIIRVKLLRKRVSSWDDEINC